MRGVGRRRAVTFLAAEAVAAGLVVACSGGHSSVAPPATIGAVTTTTATTLPDYASVTLAPVSGQSTLAPVAVTPGPVAVSGTVVDDVGAPVAAATVSLQRIVGAASGTTQVTTAEDGTWSAQGILGGLYRIRAWRAPDLAQPGAAVVFLSATASNAAVALKLQRYNGTTVQAAVSPDPPILGEPASLVVQVTTASVGSDGIIRSPPQVGAIVALTASGQWSIDGNPEQATSGSGQAGWQATCEALGDQALSVTIDGGNPVALAVPACSPVPTTTTSAAPTSTTPSVATTVKH